MDHPCPQCAGQSHSSIQAPAPSRGQGGTAPSRLEEESLKAWSEAPTWPGWTARGQAHRGWVTAPQPHTSRALHWDTLSGSFLSWETATSSQPLCHPQPPLSLLAEASAPSQDLSVLSNRGLRLCLQPSVVGGPSGLQRTDQAQQPGNDLATWPGPH